MPLKLDWKTHLFSRSCIDLTSTRCRNDDSEIVVAVTFRGSQLALGKETTAAPKGRGLKRRRSSTSRKDRRCSVPPEESVAVVVVDVHVQKPQRAKPDVVHWKAKVGSEACTAIAKPV